MILSFLCTRHYTLKYFCNQPDLKNQQAKWAEFQEFHFKIQYIKKKDNLVIDTLSRMMYNLSFTMLDSSLLQEIKEATNKGEYLSSIWSTIHFEMNYL